MSSATTERIAPEDREPPCRGRPGTRRGSRRQGSCRTRHQDQGRAQLIRSAAHGGRPSLQQLVHVLEREFDRPNCTVVTLRLELERRDHTEVPHPPRSAPELSLFYSWKLVRRRPRGDDFGREQAVEGEAVFAQHPTDTARLGQPARHRVRVVGREREFCSYSALATRSRSTTTPCAPRHHDGPPSSRDRSRTAPPSMLPKPSAWWPPLRTATESLRRGRGAAPRPSAAVLGPGLPMDRRSDDRGSRVIVVAYRSHGMFSMVCVLMRHPPSRVGLSGATVDPGALSQASLRTGARGGGALAGDPGQHDCPPRRRSARAACAAAPGRRRRRAS